MDNKKIIYYLIIFIFISCNFSNKKIKPLNNNKDIFYNQSCGLDFIRVPLIKPFDITYYDAQGVWFLVQRPDTLVYSDNIEELTVLESNIFVHSVGKTVLEDDFVEESWYIYNTKSKEFLKGFATEKEFSKYLKSIHIDEVRLVWQKPADLYKQFKKTGCLPWIPNCK
jgi:hypothetical protein